MKIKIIIAAFLATTLTTPALAEENRKTGSYVGLELGRVSIESGSLEADGVNFGFVSGIRFNEYFAAEFGGHLANDLEFEGTSIETSYLSFSLGGRGYLPISDDFSAILKAGMHRWKYDSTVGDDSGIDPYFGGGIQISVDERIDIFAEYTVYKADDNDASVISGGLVWYF